MALILGLIIGFVVAAILVYFLSQSQIAEKNEALQRSRSRIQQLEQSHNKRLQEATRQLQQDYDQRLTQEITEAQAKAQKAHEAEVAALKAKATAAQAEAVTLKAEVTASHAEVMSLKSDIERLQHQPEDDRSVPPSTPVASAIADMAVSMADAVDTGSQAATLTPAEAETPLSDVESGSGEQSIVLGSPARRLTPSRALSQMIHEAMESDSVKRQQVALTLRDMLQQPLRAESKQAMPLLAKLCQDSDPAVRLSAIEAIAHMRSPQVIPLLKRALRDADMSVVASASQAMDKFKAYPRATSSKVTKTKKKLPKNR